MRQRMRLDSATHPQRLGLAIAAVALMLGMSIPQAVAQLTMGTVSGTVRDPQAAAVPGATINLTSETRGTKLQVVKSETSGDLVIPNVPPDTYTLEISQQGFKTVKRTGIAVSPGDRVGLGPLTLEVGTTAEAITVSAEARGTGPGRGATPGGRGPGGFSLSAFTDMMFTDLIPMVERTYRVAPGRENRAMAGLSMGGGQTLTTALNNLDRFAYLGGFSGSYGGLRSEDHVRRRVRRSGGFQQEGQSAVPRDRLRGRAGHEDLQRSADEGGNQKRLLRVSGHGARVADVAALLVRLRSALVPLASEQYYARDASVVCLFRPRRHGLGRVGRATRRGYDRCDAHGAPHREADVRRLHGAGHDPGVGGDVVRP